MKVTKLITLFLVLNSTLLFAQGINGTVKSDEGELLPFATIYIKELGTGTTTNADGYYEIKIPSGSYSLVYQYVGYEAQEHNLIVSGDFKRLDVTLTTQTVVLKDVVVKAGKEDPAYTIMRKAISKSKFHTQQVDRYTAKVYMKGTGELKDSPFFLRKTLEKEGVEEGRVFISESVSEVEYIRPNTYNEKVISVRSSGDDQNANPNAYINGSFYEPEVANSVSPLSPRAFSYYRFVYDGTYRDQGFDISKIKVIPRSQGDNVFSGHIEIVEDYWSIYSLSLSVSKLGINFKIKQFYEPIKPDVWLPVTHDFDFDGKVFGFGFEGHYLATVSDYLVEVNPDLSNEFELIDESIEKELAEEIKSDNKKKETDKIEEMLANDKPVTRKQLRKVLREYEKVELEEVDMENVESIRSFNYDSAAYTNDSLYWTQLRPVPLSVKELNGYAKTDSLAELEKQKNEGDTLKANDKKGFSLKHIITGARYKVADKTYLRLKNINSLFNTVDGFDLKTGLVFTKTYDSKNWLKVEHQSRYTFTRTAYNGILDIRYDFGETNSRSSINVSGGRYISQYNADEPIHPFANTFSTLFSENNYMKIYERDYANLSYSKNLTDKVKVKISTEFNERRELQNRSNYKVIDRSNREYTVNAPSSIELPITSFSDHQALITEASIEYEPWIKYRIYNKNRYKVDTYSPKFKFLFRKGIKDIASSDVDFDQIELAYRHTFKIGIRALGDVHIKAGTFLNDNEMFFMDYKHFMGNQTPFLTADPVGSFRMLDYYTFSTNKEYLTANFNYQMRKFLITRIPLTRVMGIRESFYVNHLATDNSMGYTELGYGINYIFRIFRLEAVTNWIDGKYNDWSVRIGIAANLDNIF